MFCGRHSRRGIWGRITRLLCNTQGNSRSRGEALGQSWAAVSSWRGLPAPQRAGAAGTAGPARTQRLTPARQRGRSRQSSPTDSTNSGSAAGSSGLCEPRDEAWGQPGGHCHTAPPGPAAPLRALRVTAGKCRERGKRRVTRPAGRHACPPNTPPGTSPSRHRGAAAAQPPVPAAGSGQGREAPRELGGAARGGAPGDGRRLQGPAGVCGGGAPAPSARPLPGPGGRGGERGGAGPAQPRLRLDSGREELGSAPGRGARGPAPTYRPPTRPRPPPLRPRRRRRRSNMAARGAPEAPPTSASASARSHAPPAAG